MKLFTDHESMNSFFVFPRPLRDFFKAVFIGVENVDLDHKIDVLTGFNLI